MTENMPAREHPEDPTKGHTGMTASTRGILLTGLGVIALIALGLAVCWAFVVWRMRGEVTIADESPPDRRTPLPNVVQPNQAFEYQQMVEAKESVLHSYGWVAPDAGIARIPIDRAITLVAEGTLPLAPIETTDDSGQDTTNDEDNM